MEPPEKVILRWDSTASEENMIFNSSDRREVDLYLHAVDEIQRSLDSTNISGDGADQHSGTIQIAMARLEEEFRFILKEQTSAMPRIPHGGGDDSSHGGGPVASRSSSSSEINLDLSAYEDLENPPETPQRSLNHQDTASSIRELDLLPNDAVFDLRAIADRMITAGYSRECIQVYASVRKEFVHESLKSLGIERLSIGDIQKLDWEILEKKIRAWIRAAQVAIPVIFSSEKKLCEEIFEGLGTNTNIEDLCFMETIKAPAVQLFNFAEAISISRRSPEKLFKILDLHDALVKLSPSINAVFNSKSSKSVRSQAGEIINRLQEAARGILSEFENAVLREPSTLQVPGGTIHPLTRYVMNYISLISDYKTTMAELIKTPPTTGSRYSGDSNTPELDLTEYEEHSALELHLIWIIVILQFNIDGKSKHYKEASLSHLFMMNNVHYITQKIKGSTELRAMIKDTYLRRLTGKFRQAATAYQRSTWVKVLHCLRDEGLHVSGSFSSGVSKSALRERFKMFNAMFEEVHRTQATWLIPDTQLREELRISMSEKLIPAYRSFLGRFRSHIENGRHPENYIKYSVEDLENAVLDFFEGYPVSQHLRRRSG